MGCGGLEGFVYLDETMLEMLHLLTVASLFAAAWLISRGAAYVARKVLIWHDRHTEAAAATVDLRIANVKRRETTVAVIRAAIAYAAFAVAIVLSAAQLTGGMDKLSTLAGASFVIILAGFAIQRVLMDVIAGTMMFVERCTPSATPSQSPRSSSKASSRTSRSGERSCARSTARRSRSRTPRFPPCECSQKA